MIIAPSLLSANFLKLSAEIRCVEMAGAGQLHLDVMDGQYVPNLTFGPVIVKAVRTATQLPLDVHLMIEHAEKWIDPFINAGADMIAVHPETLYHPHLTLTEINDKGKKAGIAINPGLSLAYIEDLLPFVDYIIVMSVNPGWGGQSFINGSFERVNQVRELCAKVDRPITIEIDGGMNTERITPAITAGVDVTVAGSAIFGAEDPGRVVRDMLRTSEA